MSIIIGQGETKTLTYQITDKDNIFDVEDKLLFAIKNIDDEVVFTDETTINDLPFDNKEYAYSIELTSNFTKTLTLGIEKYFYDLTLLKDDKKIPLTNVKSIDVIETVGASISEG